MTRKDEGNGFVGLPYGGPLPWHHRFDMGLFLVYGGGATLFFFSFLPFSKICFSTITLHVTQGSCESIGFSSLCVMSGMSQSLCFREKLSYFISSSCLCEVGRHTVSCKQSLDLCKKRVEEFHVEWCSYWKGRGDKLSFVIKKKKRKKMKKGIVLEANP